ncbi:MAG: flagellar protein FlgN [Gallionella sp.]
MEKSKVTRLLAALTAEQAGLAGFISLLEREQALLVENLSDQLLELAEKKTNFTLDLNRLAQQRLALLQEFIPQLGMDSIQTWLNAHSPECMAVWQSILDLAKRSRQLNRTNGELIQIKLRHNQQTLAALSNAASKANLYGPDGQPDFSPGSGRSLGCG